MSEQSEENSFKFRPDRKEMNGIIPINQFRPYANNPFKIYVDNPEHELVKDIKENGVRDSILARFTLGETNEAGEDLYEIISGHNRLEAAKLAGLDAIPAKIETIQDNEAETLIVSLNIRRTKMTPSEYGKVFRFRLDAKNRQGDRTDLTSDEHQHKSSRDEVGIDFGVSGSKVRQYIRFSYLINELQDALDNK